MTPPATGTTAGPAPGAPDAPGAPRARVLRASLWLVLVVSAVGNTLAPAFGAATTAHLGFAAVTASCVAALVAVHLRGRR